MLPCDTAAVSRKLHLSDYILQFECKSKNITQNLTLKDLIKKSEKNELRPMPMPMLMLKFDFVKCFKTLKLDIHLCQSRMDP